MTDFAELKKIIGRDVEYKIKKLNEEGYTINKFSWEFLLGFKRYVLKVAEEYRTNILSKIDGQYTLLYSIDNKDMIYPNVHDYLSYLNPLFFYSNSNRRITDFTYLYVWDKYNKKLIEIWEFDPNQNHIVIDEEFGKIYFRKEYEKFKEKGYFRLFNQ